MSHHIRGLAAAGGALLLGACWATITPDRPDGAPEDEDPAEREATEAECADGMDNDGDSHVDCDDPGCETHCSFCVDSDGDGYSTDPTCGEPLDCDDTRAEVSPGAPQRCGTASDHNCDGIVDELSGCTGGAYERGVGHLEERAFDPLHWNSRPHRLTGPLFVSGSYLYAPSEIRTEEEGVHLALLKIDVSRPENTHVVAEEDIGLWHYGIHFQHIYKWGDTVYATACGDAYEGWVFVTNDTEDGLGDVSSLDLQEYLWSTTVTWGRAYVSAHMTGVYVLNQSADVVRQYEVPGSVRTIARGEHLYITSVSGDPFTVHDAATGRRLGHADLPRDTFLYAISMHESHAYVVGIEQQRTPGLFAINVADPREPTLDSFTPVDAPQVWDVFAFDSALVVTHDTGLTVYDTTNPAEPRQSFHLAYESQVLGAFVSGRYLYTVDTVGGLRIFEIFAR